MENGVGKLYAKLDKIQERLNSIDITLAAQHESLKYHIKRTNLLESKIEKIEGPATVLNGLLKIFGAVSIILSVIAAIIKLTNG